MKKLLELIGAALLMLVVAAPGYIALQQFSYERGSRSSPELTNLSILSAGLRVYTEDWSVFPPMQSRSAVRGALAEYGAVTRDSSGRTRSTLEGPKMKQPFQPNPFLSGRKRADFRGAEKWMVTFFNVSKMHPAGGWWLPLTAASGGCPPTSGGG